MQAGFLCGNRAPASSGKHLVPETSSLPRLSLLGAKTERGSRLLQRPWVCPGDLTCPTAPMSPHGSQAPGGLKWQPHSKMRCSEAYMPPGFEAPQTEALLPPSTNKETEAPAVTCSDLRSMVATALSSPGWCSWPSLSPALLEPGPQWALPTPRAQPETHRSRGLGGEQETLAEATGQLSPL